MRPDNIWLGRGPLPQTKETAKLMINTKAYNAEDIGARTCIYIILLSLFEAFRTVTAVLKMAVVSLQMGHTLLHFNTQELVTLTMTALIPC